MWAGGPPSPVTPIHVHTRAMLASGTAGVRSRGRVALIRIGLPRVGQSTPIVKEHYLVL
jgi:hypothetical protein